MLASPPSHMHMVKRLFSLSDPGIDGIFGIYSTGAFK